MKKILFLCIFLVNQYIVIGQPSIAWTISYPDSIFGATLRDAITDNGGNIIIAAARPYSNFNNNIIRLCLNMTLLVIIFCFGLIPTHCWMKPQHK